MQERRNLDTIISDVVTGTVSEEIPKREMEAIGWMLVSRSGLPDRVTRVFDQCYTPVVV